MTSSLDRRRFNGPETHAPRYLSRSHFQSLPSSADASASSSSSIRSAAAPAPPRQAHSQPFLITLGTSPQASGSSYVEAQSTRLVCAVYGPRQAKGRTYNARAELNVEARYAPFASISTTAVGSAGGSDSQRRKPGKDVEAAALSAALRSALLPSIRVELLPKASIDVHITIIQSPAAGAKSQRWDDTLCLPWAVIAASAAIADAGIEMWALVVGSCASVPRSPNVLPHVHPHVDQDAHSTVTLCSMPSLGSVTALEISSSDGERAVASGLEEVDQTISALSKTNESLHFTVARALQQAHLNREAAR